MKSVLNGGLQLSRARRLVVTRATTATNGWALNGDVDRRPRPPGPRARAGALPAARGGGRPRLLRPRRVGIPRAWLARLRASMKTNGPRFSASRMVRDYEDQLLRAAVARLNQRQQRRAASSSRVSGSRTKVIATRTSSSARRRVGAHAAQAVGEEADAQLEQRAGSVNASQDGVRLHAREAGEQRVLAGEAQRGRRSRRRPAPRAARRRATAASSSARQRRASRPASASTQRVARPEAAVDGHPPDAGAAGDVVHREVAQARTRRRARAPRRGCGRSPPGPRRRARARAAGVMRPRPRSPAAPSAAPAVAQVGRPELAARCAAAAAPRRRCAAASASNCSRSACDHGQPEPRAHHRAEQPERRAACSAREAGQRATCQAPLAEVAGPAAPSGATSVRSTVRDGLRRLERLALHRRARSRRTPA